MPNQRRKSNPQRKSRQSGKSGGGRKPNRKAKSGKGARSKNGRRRQDIFQGPKTEFSGVMECLSADVAFVRGVSLSFSRKASDPYVPRRLIEQNRLRPGVVIEGVYQQNWRGKNATREVHTVNGFPPEVWAKTTVFDQGTVIAPEEHLRLETDGDNVPMRMVDLVTPLGKGQRALIVAAARTGKTILIQQMARSVLENYPDAGVVILLVDERPEEITDMRRNVGGEVFGSSNDRDADSHLRVAKLTAEYVKRRVEAGEDIVLFIDSLTRLGRAFNRAQVTSGRTMTGGVDIKALEVPRQIFGAARKIENGGSLTIVASILVDTGSRMDELIFQEFKGTGNMEIVLDRKLVEERIFPAINIAKSGTRREELLWQDSTAPLQMLRRYLSKLPTREATQRLIEIVKKTSSNAALIKGIIEGSI